jgi:hypothetical protein
MRWLLGWAIMSCAGLLAALVILHPGSASAILAIAGVWVLAAWLGFCLILLVSPRARKAVYHDDWKR